MGWLKDLMQFGVFMMQQICNRVDVIQNNINRILYISYKRNSLFNRLFKVKFKQSKVKKKVFLTCPIYLNHYFTVFKVTPTMGLLKKYIFAGDSIWLWLPAEFVQDPDNKSQISVVGLPQVSLSISVLHLIYSRRPDCYRESVLIIVSSS